MLCCSMGLRDYLERNGQKKEKNTGWETVNPCFRAWQQHFSCVGANLARQADGTDSIRQLFFFQIGLGSSTEPISFL